VIASVHIADLGARRAISLLRPGRRAPEAPGLRYAEAAGTVPLAGRAPPLPPRGVALIASWDDDAALDRFLESHPLAGQLASGWHVRLEPRRIVGAWPEMPGLPAQEQPMDPDEPAAVLTLGRPRLLRFPRFVRTSRPAEKLAAAHPALVAGTAMARIPGFVATFSLWRTVAQMRDYSLGRPDPSHLNAIKADRSKAFHHQEAFVRFRPYASHGTWKGRDPLAALDLGQPAV
jgi:hypothetical protein